MSPKMCAVNFGVERIYVLPWYVFTYRQLPSAAGCLDFLASEYPLHTKINTSSFLSDPFRLPGLSELPLKTRHLLALLLLLFSFFLLLRLFSFFIYYQQNCNDEKLFFNCFLQILVWCQLVGEFSLKKTKYCRHLGSYYTYHNNLRPHMPMEERFNTRH